MNRREMLISAGAAYATASNLVFSSGVRADDFSERKRLQLPKLLDAQGTGRLELTAMDGSVNFTGRATSETYGFNQDYLGPTLRIANGAVQAKVQNTLNEAITVHWHGLLLPGVQDGGPHQEMAQNQNWQPQLDVSQAPSTAWYHTHIHEHTARQVLQRIGWSDTGDGRARPRQRFAGRIWRQRSSACVARQAPSCIAMIGDLNVSVGSQADLLTKRRVRLLSS
jgi:blue copper oxidase